MLRTTAEREARLACPFSHSRAVAVSRSSEASNRSAADPMPLTSQSFGGNLTPEVPKPESQWSPMSGGGAQPILPIRPTSPPGPPVDPAWSGQAQRLSGSLAAAASHVVLPGRAAYSRPWQWDRQSPTFPTQGSNAQTERRRPTRGAQRRARQKSARSRRLLLAPGVERVVHRRF